MRRAFVFLCVFLAATLPSCGKKKNDQVKTAGKEPVGKPIKLEKGNELWSSFHNDPRGADSKYLGQLVEFATTYARPLGKRDGSYCLGDYVTDRPDQFGPEVICFMDKEEFDKAGNNQRLAIRGLCKGWRRSSEGFKGIQVTVVDCQIVEVQK